MARKRPLTLLYGAKDTERSQAVVIREMLEYYGVGNQIRAGNLATVSWPFLPCTPVIDAPSIMQAAPEPLTSRCMRTGPHGSEARFGELHRSR